MPKVVKGSKQEKMIVVPYRPLRRWMINLCLLAGIGVSIAAGFGYGYYTSLDRRQLEQDSLDDLRQEVAGLKLENEGLNRQLVVLERSSQMDQQANAELQVTLSDLRGRLAELQQEIVHYRHVVAEQTEDTGLLIDEFTITATGDPGQYRYKLVMRQQDADGDTYLSGHANVDLVGHMNGQQVRIPLRDVSQELEQLDIRLRFRYFQNIEGELALPEGFSPQLIEIAAVATEPVAKRIGQEFPWPADSE